MSAPPRALALALALAMLAAPGSALAARGSAVPAAAMSSGAAAHGPTATDSRAARHRARDILSERRFRAAPLPHPVRGLFRRLGVGLQIAFDAVASRLPGGHRTLWILIAAAVLVAVWRLTARSVRRRVAAGLGSATERGRIDEREQARRLEQAAAEAERAGDFSAAVRLRFRAGLLRLDAKHAIAFRPSIPTAEVSRRLRSAEFDTLAGTFDQVVYGGRAAELADAEAARDAWPRVLSEAPAR